MMPFAPAIVDDHLLAPTLPSVSARSYARDIDPGAAVVGRIECRIGPAGKISRIVAAAAWRDGQTENTRRQRRNNVRAHETGAFKAVFSPAHRGAESALHYT